MWTAHNANLQKVAVLANAFDRVVKEPLNGVGEITFSMPYDDPKCAYLAPFSWVRTDDGAFYRILSDGVRVDATGFRTYTAEHGIACLVDDVMPFDHVIGNIDIQTSAVIGHILWHQTVPRWQLGRCDFAKQFEYGFSWENLLNALFSVPNLFVEPYQWVYNFQTTPWTVSLAAIDSNKVPDFTIRSGRNLLSENAARSMVDVATRIYMLGFGEGDNQLTIADVNGGVPYLDAPQAYINRYGLITKVIVDRTFEDAESLKERGLALLTQLREPQYARQFGVVDLSPLTNFDLDTARPGDKARLTMDGTEAMVTMVTHRLDVPGDMSLELSTTAINVVDLVADIASRQRIEQVYAQGATQLYGQSVQANADTNTAAEMRFYLPAELKIVNKVIAHIKIDRFRSFNRMTYSGGASTSTSSSGGSQTPTSGPSGGGSVTSEASSKTTVSISSIMSGLSNIAFTKTANGAGMTMGNTAALATGSAGTGSTGSVVAHSHTTNQHAHSMAAGATTTGYSAPTVVSGGAHTHTGPSHTHTVAAHTHAESTHNHDFGDHGHYMNHSHDISHTHTVPVPSHTHSVTVAAHAHSVDVPSHSHDVQQGIYRFGNPTGATVLIDGHERFVMEEEREVDLTPYLVNSQGKIPRGRFIRLGVKPNDLAYVSIDLFVQGFVQSRGGGHY